MKRRKMFKGKGWIIPVAILVLSIAGLIITLHQHSFDLKQFNYNSLIFYTILLMLHYLISSFPTPIYLADNRYMTSFLLHRLSLVSGYLLPLKIGIPMKVYFFKKYLGTPISKTSAAVVFESTIGVGIFLLGGIYLGTLKYFTFKLHTVLVFFAVLAILLFIISKNVKRFYRFRVIKKIANFVVSVKNSLIEGSRNLNRVLFIIGITLIVILLMILRIKFLLNAVDQSLSFLQVARVVFISTLITTLSMIPGGYAVREASYSFFLVQEGVPLELALLVVFIDRILTTGSSFFLGIVSSILIMKRHVISE